MRRSKVIKALKILSIICSMVIIFCSPIADKAYAGKMTGDVTAQEGKGYTADISIDGYYDDWEDKPMSTLTWRSNNGEERHDVSFIKDEKNIYIYVKMHPYYQSPIPITAIYLSVNNQQCQLFLAYANNQLTTDWGHPVNLTKNGTYVNLHPFTYYPNNSLGDAAVTVSEGSTNDRMEIRISISELEKVMNLKQGTISNGSTINLRMPNVGEGSVELVGTPTGPVLGIILCIGIVVIIYLLRLRKSKKVRLAD